MKYKLLISLALLVDSLIGFAHATTQLAPLTIKQIDQQLIINANRYGIAGQSVLILKNHTPIYQGNAGFANVELSVPISEHHLFPSYSVTKLFTSVLVMQLVEKGVIELKKSIRHYLPYLPEHWQKITVEHTLNHTSGIPRYFDIAMKSGAFLPNKKSVFLSLTQQPAHFEMGTKNNYNNTNFLILSAILENKTGKTYQELVKNIIIKPLNLTGTGHASAKSVIDNMVTSYQGKNGLLRKNIDIDWPDYTFAHSGLYSTATDLSKFMTALVTGEFVRVETLIQFWQPMELNNGTTGRYAFGFEYSVKDGFFQLGHDGGNRVKLRHYFKTNPNMDSYTLAYLTNGNKHSVWTDILADSVMLHVDPNKFKQANLSAQFMTAALSKDKVKLENIYDAISVSLNNNPVKTERFILEYAYAIRYGVGADSAIPAFEFLSAKFPSSGNAWDSLAEMWQSIGNKQKAIEFYKQALTIDPTLTNAKNQLLKLEG